MAEIKREPERDFQTIEQARNAGIAWIESRGVVFGPHRRIEIGRLGVMTGKEVGVRADQGPFWRLASITIRSRARTSMWNTAVAPRARKWPSSSSAPRP